MMQGVSVQANGGGTLSGGASKTLDGATLINAGTLTWTDGIITQNNPSTLRNLAAATFNIQVGDVSNGFELIVNVLDNEGTTVRSVSTDAVEFASCLTNNGLLDVQTGSLSLALAPTGVEAGASGGTFHGAAGTTLELRGGDLTSTSRIVAENANLTLTTNVGDGGLSVDGSTAALTGRPRA